MSKSTLPFKRGHFKNDHAVVCKHCGWGLVAHGLQKDGEVSEHFVNDTKERRPRYKNTLAKCVSQKNGGYEPSNKSRWLRTEQRSEREKDSAFEMECFEADARRRAAWNHYAAYLENEEYEEALRTGDTEAIERMRSIASLGRMRIG